MPGTGRLCGLVRASGASFSGLTVDQVHGVLSAWRLLPRGTKTWEEVVAAGNSGDPYPRGPFAYLVQSLRRYECPQLSSR